MLHWNLLTISSLLVIASGHVTIDGSKGSTNERVPVSVHEKDLYQQNYHRSLALENEFKLQFSWFNWNLCSNAFPNASFTPMNSFVPNNTVFLAGYPTFNLDNSSATCKDKTITRKGTISTGQQTVFFPLYNQGSNDWDDDWKNGTCGAQFPNQTDKLRFDDGENYNAAFTNVAFTEKLYLLIDGKNATPIYLYDKMKYFYTACDEKNRTYEEYLKLIDPADKGDPCDVNSFQPIGGLDVAPLLGWYGIDIRTWADGENHTYEFGSLEVGPLTKCITAKYSLTAKAPPNESTYQSSDEGASQRGQVRFVWPWNLLSFCLVEMVLWPV